MTTEGEYRKRGCIGIMRAVQTEVDMSAWTCPTCTTQVPEGQIVCPVCGTAKPETQIPLQQETTRSPALPSTTAWQGPRVPVITLSVPMALFLLALFVSLGAGAVYAVLQRTNRIVVPTPVPTDTPTLTPTLTPTPITPTPTYTPLPSPTPLTYIVKEGDTCLSIAFTFKVSVPAIVLLNNLPANCPIYVGQKLLIPQPTPTATPEPTDTLSPEEATRAACETITYTVKANDTLLAISLNYNVSMEAIKEWNGLVSDTVYEGMSLIIPLCMRNATPGPSPTPTPPPPYPAPVLLYPPDGAVFAAADTVTLQWAAVGTLRENEAYAVYVVDLTAEEERRLVEYVTDTKFVVPDTFRHTEAKPHVYRWWVVTVRQTGTDEEGLPIWEPAGAASAQRTFVWGGLVATSTPAP